MFIFACSEDEQRSCPIVGSGTSNDASCIAAAYFAARDTNYLIPTQVEVTRYFERWERVLAAEPILISRVPQRYRGDFGSRATVYTSNSVVIRAWNVLEEPIDRPAPKTTDAGVDALLGELVEPRLFRWGTDTGDGATYIFDLRNSAIFNEEVMHQRLLQSSSWLQDQFQHHRDDGSWTWQSDGGTGSDEATAEINFSFGWGDCFVSCTGMHDLRAIVPPTGDAVVYDLGGDPLPSNLSLSPNTLPPQ